VHHAVIFAIAQLSCWRCCHVSWPHHSVNWIHTRLSQRPWASV